MKFVIKIKSTAFLLLIFSGLFVNNSFAQKGQNDVPWSSNQAIKPSELAAEINSGAAKNILIINSGSVNDIKGAVNIGPLGDKENQKKLSKYLKDIPKDKSIVIYCGCCPMNHCPNIRPAYQILKEKGFTNFKILDIKENIAVDWISKGYPLAKGN
jgi:hypothetical protein